MTTNHASATSPRRPVQLVRLRFEDFRGFEEIDLEIGELGTLVEGRNGEGKSTLADGIRVLLFGREADAGDVRIGATRARLLGKVDFGDGAEPADVVRTIQASGGTKLEIRTADGMKPTRPQEWLEQKLGPISGFDPSRFLTLDPIAQAKAVGDAMPVALTPEHLARWGVDGQWDLTGHGLAALDRIRARFYDERTAANARMKDARSQAAAARSSADTSRMMAPEGALPLVEAEREERAAAARVTALEEQARRAEESERSTAEARKRIADLRSLADEELARGPSRPEDADVVAADVQLASATARVAELRAALAAAETEERTARDRVGALQRQTDAAGASSRRAEDLRGQAKDLERTVASLATPRPSADDLAAASEALTAARSATAAAQLAAEALREEETAARAEAAAESAVAEAARLDALVTRLTKDAPAELLSEVHGIPGLGITAKGITLDDVPFAKCSTSQRMEFAVRVALLASPNVGWIQCDNMESFDRAHFGELVRLVISAGRKLNVFRVASCTLTIGPLEAPEPPAAPETLPAPPPSDDACPEEV